MSNTLPTTCRYSISIELTPNAAGRWFAEISLLGEYLPNGENWENAPEMTQDAKRAWLTTTLELGLPIPEPEPVAH